MTTETVLSAAALATAYATRTPEELFDKVHSLYGLPHAVLAKIYAAGVKVYMEGWVDTMIQNHYQDYARNGRPTISRYLYAPPYGEHRNTISRSIMQLTGLQQRNHFNDDRGYTTRAPYDMPAIMAARTGSRLYVFMDRSSVTHSGTSWNQYDAPAVLSEPPLISRDYRTAYNNMLAKNQEGITAAREAFPHLRDWLQQLQ